MAKTDPENHSADEKGRTGRREVGRMWVGQFFMREVNEQEVKEYRVFQLGEKHRCMAVRKLQRSPLRAVSCSAHFSPGFHLVVYFIFTSTVKMAVSEGEKKILLFNSVSTLKLFRK